MKGSFQGTLIYARKRKQGGHAIINWSAVLMLLAEMVVKIAGAEMIFGQAMPLRCGLKSAALNFNEAKIFYQES
jgi:alkylation response protein AidB-like acyl-CoA dehydrogenase